MDVYRTPMSTSTGSIQFPTAELVDPEGCSQGAMSHNQYNPDHRDNLLAAPLRISPVQILTHLYNRDHHLGREYHLILSIRRHRNHPLPCRHTLLHIKPLRWQHQDRVPVRATYLHRSLALTVPVPPVGVLCPVVATRLVQRPAQRPPPHPLLTNY